MGKEIALMFSGGVDSTIAAAMLAEKYDKVHLLTYNNGYGHMFMESTKKRVDELNKRFPDKFAFNLSSTKELFEKITVNNVVNEYKEHKSGFVWCMGCKLGMHTKSIIYCLENGIPNMADGSSKDTESMVEQKPFSIALIRSIYERFNINFYTPVYNIPRKEKIKELKNMRFNLGWLRVMDRFLGIQPKCFAGEIYYLPSVLFNSPPTHDNHEILRFFNRKIDLIEKTIANHLIKDGKDIINLKDRLAIAKNEDIEDGMLQY
jgi:predicted subunit of tRNA(5-methylaminomethyl-2-thiouridylate) methyltransferase